ncbi:uncharacterized protein LOC117604687 isoform X1 [Osmia lignaria lignaria]|uniref:uncharacterized protein LOC117604687 isoform X1 n=2 Tax=Osmia lignaria lignaria TaxID=1437193 RepID=UPI00402B1F72
MLLKLIIHAIFLCAGVSISISKHVNHSDSIISPKNQLINSSNFTLVNSESVHHLEKALQRFLSKIADPINGTIVLQSTSKNGKDVQLSIRKMCESMQKALARFADDCQLDVRLYKQNLINDPLSDDWYSESLLQGAYILRDLGNVINGIGTSIRMHFRDGNATAVENKQVTRQPESFQFLGVVYNAAEFTENLSKCLLQMPDTRSRNSFSINREVLNLAKHSPKVAIKKLKSNLNTISLDQVPKTRTEQKYWQVILCLSMINKQGSYENCIRDLQKLDSCLLDSKQRSENKRKSIHANTWVKAIERLSDCKIQADKSEQVEVSCKSVRETPKKMQQKVKYAFERMLDKKITKKSPLHRAAMDLADTMSQSKLGQSFVDELLQYFEIFEDGKRKLQRFSTKNKTGISRRNEIVEALQTYRRGILLRTFNAIDKMHRSVSTFEQFLVKGIKDTLNEAWQSHLNVLSSLMKWMNKLLELYSGETVSENGQSSPNDSLADDQWNEDESSFSEDSLEHSIATRSRPEIMKEADVSMKDLIESMNSVNKYRSSNDSMLSCVANNLLLVTIFMGTIGFVSSLYCFDYSMKDEENSLDFNNEWKRAPRSLPLEYRQIVNLVSQDDLLLEFRDNSSAPISNYSD